MGVRERLKEFPGAAWAAAQTRTGSFLFQTLFLCGLLSVAGLYFVETFSLPANLGSVPLGVPWFGAVGAVIISLTGIFEHAGSWNTDYAFWHWSRPLIGATLGTVSVLMFQAGILAVGSTPTTPGNAAAPKNLLYYLIAFAVGYREQTFRDLLKRLLDVILSPGNAAAGAQHAVLSISPVSGPGAGGTSVAVTGAGLSNTRSVKFGTQQAGFHIDSDHHLTVVSPAATSSGPAVITVQLRDRNLTGPPFTYQPTLGSE
jgi:IPT/TIG domain